MYNLSLTHLLDRHCVILACAASRLVTSDPGFTECFIPDWIKAEKMH